MSGDHSTLGVRSEVVLSVMVWLDGLGNDRNTLTSLI